MNLKEMMAVLAVTAVVLCIIAVIPVSNGAETAEETDATMDLADFVTAVAESGYDYDGNGVTVSWIPTSACTLNHSVDSTVCMFHGSQIPDTDGNNPQRVQNGNAQYGLFDDQNDVTIKNVNFVYTYSDDDSDFTLCQQDRGPERTGTFGYDEARNAELQFLNDGDLTLVNCDFNRVIVSPFSCYGTTTIELCDFSDIYNAYSVKDVYSENATISICTFNNCSGGIYFEGNNDKGTYTLTNNKFTNMDQNAATDKVGTRGLVQFSAKGDYSNATVEMEGNEYSGEGPIFRQLNETITPSVLDTEKIQQNNSFPTITFTEDTVEVSNGKIYLDPNNGDDTTGDGSADDPYKTFQKAVDSAKSGDTIVIMSTARIEGTIDKPLTITSEGGEPLSFQNGTVIGEVNGTVRFENLSFQTVGVGQDNMLGADTSGLKLEVIDCVFENAGGNCLHIDQVITSLTVENSVFNVTSNFTSYLIWTFYADSVDITGCTFNGGGQARGAIHLGDGTSQSLVANITGNTISGFERGVTAALTNEGVQNRVTISGNTFSNIADNPKDSKYDEQHVATVYIHSSQKAGTTAIDYFDNVITGGSGRVFFTNSPTIPVQAMVNAETFQGNTLNGTAIENLSDVCYDPWLAMVDGTGYATLDEALAAADNAEDKTVTLLENVYLDHQLDLSTAGITIDLGGYTITSSDDFSSSDENSSHLLNVTAENITVKNGTLEITNKNKHVVNAYGAGLTLRDVVLDASEGGEGFHAPLIINGSMVTLGGNVTFNGGSYYSINIDTTVSGVSDAGLITEAETKLVFNGVPWGIYNEMSSVAGETATIKFGEDTEYLYDSDGFILIVSADTDSVNDEDSYDPIDRVENPIYVVTIRVDPADANIVIENYVGTVQNGDTIELQEGTYRVTISMDGYETKTVSLVVGAGQPNVLEEKLDKVGASTDPDDPSDIPGGDDTPVIPPIDDDDDYVPLPPQVVYDDTEDDGNVEIIACAAAAVVAALMAVFLILAYRRD